VKNALVKRFAVNVSRLRQERKLSQEAFAEKVKISQGYVALLENATRAPSLEMIGKLADALGVKPSDLFKEKV